MKAKKILSLVLALCMVLSVLSAGFVVANAAETGELYDEIAANVEPNAEAYAGANTDTDENVGEASSVWTGTFDCEVTLTKDEQKKYLALILDHYADSDDFGFLPAQIIATQDVSGGTLKSLITWTSYSDAKMEQLTVGLTQEQKERFKLLSVWYTIFTIFEDSKGNLTLLKAVIIDPSDVKTLDKNTQNANAPWVIKEQPGSSKYTAYDFNRALKDYTEISLTPIANIATEFDEETLPLSFKYLCYGTVNGKTNLYVATIDFTDDTYSDVEVTDVAYFDINQYMTTDTSKVVKDTNDDTQKSTSTDKDDSDDNNDNVKKDTSSKSPKTGSNDFASAFAILFFVSCLAGVSAYKFSKKRG